jgi:antitoxin HicB
VKEAMPKKRIMSRRHRGTSLDSFLKEEGIFEETQVLSIKEVVVWHLT